MEIKFIGKTKIKQRMWVPQAILDEAEGQEIMWIKCGHTIKAVEIDAYLMEKESPNAISIEDIMKVKEIMERKLGITIFTGKEEKIAKIIKESGGDRTLVEELLAKFTG